MENIIGKAKSYLEEKGVDTSNMTMEEIIAKYQELINQEETKKELAEEVVEQEEELAEDKAEDEAEESELDVLIAENQEIIDGLTEEQKALFDKIIGLIK